MAADVGDLLFDRRAKLTIAIPVATPGDYANVTSEVVEISGSNDPANPGNRIQFKVKRTKEKEPNPGEITITNLSPTRRLSLQTKGVKLVLEVGYADTGVVRLFTGDVRTCDHKREGSDWETLLKCADGERSFRWARAAEAFAGGTAAADVLKYLAKQMGLDAGNVADEAKKISVKFQQGYTVFGSAQQALDRLLSSIGYTWSIQDGVLQVLATDAALTGLAIPLISSDTGLVGSPEAGTPEKKGGAILIKFKSLIDKQVRPGGSVHLKSQRYDSDLKVKSVQYDGDTAGGPWYAEIQGTLTHA